MLQQLTKDFEMKLEEINLKKDKYQETFHKLVISHENYMQCEEDVAKRDLMYTFLQNFFYIIYV